MGLSGAFIHYSLPVPASISTSTVLSVAGASPASCCTAVAAIVVATLAAVAAAVVAAVVAASPVSGRLRSRHTCSILVGVYDMVRVLGSLADRRHLHLLRKFAFFAFENDVSFDPLLEPAGGTMPQHAEVALHGRVHRVEVDQPGRVFLGYVPHTGLHFLDGLRRRLAPSRIDPAAHIGDTAADEADRGLAVEFEVQHFVKVFLNEHAPLVQHLGVRVQQYHVVHVPDIVVGPELVLDILIQLVETDVCEQLAGEVADRHTYLEKPLRRRHLVGAFARRQAERGMVAAHDHPHEPEKTVLARIFTR